MRHAILALAVLLAACGTEPVDSGTTAEPPDAADVAVDGGEPADAGAADAAEDPCTKPGVRTIVKLELEPASVSVIKGNLARIAVTATFDDGCQNDVTGSVYYSVGDALVAKVDTVAADPNNGSPLAGRAVNGLAKGATTVVASTKDLKQGVVSNAIDVTVTEPTVTPPPTETRAVWVTRFAFSSDKTTGPAQVKKIIDTAAANGFNAVFFQVRGTGDAYYKSALAPWWVKDSTGKLGVDPGWDPLQVAVDEAHLKKIQLHAYINAMTGPSKSGTAPGTVPDSIAGAPKHILRQHPEWTCLDASGAESASEYMWVAAEAGYRDHFAAIAEEILTNYAVDGIHLDRIRAPGTSFCHSPGLDAAFKAKYGTDNTKWPTFYRAQIDDVVRAVYDKVKAVQGRKVLLSAAVWGIYKRLPGCSTSEGYSGYFQDSVGWAQKGIIDGLCPMMYWDIKPGGCTDWAALLDGFMAGANGRQIIAGMHVHDDTGAANFAKMNARVDYSRKKGAAGTIIFASAYLDQASLWDEFLAGPYKTPIAPTPITFR